MKHLYSIILAVLLLTSTATAQIPNGSFENWNTDGNPDGWITTNFVGVATPITKSSTAADGQFSLRGEVLSIFGQPLPAMAGTGRMVSESEFILGFPYTNRPAAMNGFFSTQLSALDTLNVIVVFRSGGDSIGVGFFRTGNDVASLTAFSAPIYWIDSRTPDTAYVMIIVDGEPQPTLGTNFLVDGLSFGPAASVAETGRIGGVEVTAIRGGYELALYLPSLESAKLEIVDVQGRTVETLLNGPAQHERIRWYGDGLANGMYVARLTTSRGVQHQKLLLGR
jgi:hypothetical protein